MGRSLKLHDLRRILKSFGVQEDPSRGKGSHTLFTTTVAGQKVTYPVPTSRSEVSSVYVAGCRKRFRLTPGDGILDQEFFSR